MFIQTLEIRLVVDRNCLIKHKMKQHWKKQTPEIRQCLSKSQKFISSEIKTVSSEIGTVSLNQRKTTWFCILRGDRENSKNNKRNLFHHHFCNLFNCTTFLLILVIMYIFFLLLCIILFSFGNKGHLIAGTKGFLALAFALALGRIICTWNFWCGLKYKHYIHIK